MAIAVDELVQQQREPVHTHAQKRSSLWLVAAFLVCPCHLPLLLVALGAGVSGGLLTRNQGLLFLMMSVLFGLAVWRYLAPSKAQESCSACAASRESS